MEKFPLELLDGDIAVVTAPAFVTAVVSLGDLVRIRGASGGYEISEVIRPSGWGTFSFHAHKLHAGVRQRLAEMECSGCIIVRSQTQNLHAIVCPPGESDRVRRILDGLEEIGMLEYACMITARGSSMGHTPAA